MNVAGRFLVAAFVVTMLSAGTSLSAQALDGSGVKKAKASVKTGVVAGLNEYRGTSTPARCFKVWVSRSDSRWATFQLSSWATVGPPCMASDGSGLTFLRRSNAGEWVYAGSGPGWRQTKCKFRVSPPQSVPEDFGCHWWKVLP